jgi:hypothetical protein
MGLNATNALTGDNASRARPPIQPACATGGRVIAPDEALRVWGQRPQQGAEPV